MSDTQIPPRKSKTLYIIVLIAILVLANAVQLWISRQDKQEIEEKEEVIKTKSEDLSKLSISLDSVRKELEIKVAEIKRLGGDTASIGLLKRQVERDLKNARRQNFKSRELIADLKARLEDYELQLEAKDKEIDRLKAENQALFADNKKLKTQIVKTEDSISRLSETKAKLSEQVAMASKLRAEEIKVLIIDNKGREKEDDDYRAKKISKLKVVFKIADNKVAKIENKEVFLRITDPEGAYLYDIGSGGGIFQIEGRESPYTSKLSFLFDNKQPNLYFVWDKGSAYKTGTYTIELFSEGVKIGQTNFVVR